MKDRIYQSALGITTGDIVTGDIVTTSYDTGPYEVWLIRGPRYITSYIGALVVRDFPVISLTLVKPGEPRRGDDGFYWINDIRQEGERWFTDANDEVFVEKRSAPGLQMDMFSQRSEPRRYEFDPDVDYEGKQEPVWHYERCDRDFNAPPSGRWTGAYCQTCNRVAQRIHFIRKDNTRAAIRARFG